MVNATESEPFDLFGRIDECLKCYKNNAEKAILINNKLSCSFPDDMNRKTCPAHGEMADKNHRYCKKEIQKPYIRFYNKDCAQNYN